ncbi:prephenate dehydratase [Methanobacterium ferruginis]|jgi:prephenate dehydratase|uniref:prephenate dehydratase n=1 Tax=Methanobacterium ferruginis TaxID=710191 RepID=UPI0025745C6F|nr:prephenate dehydratase [Methanobacterium ferruginis]MCC7550402.1 prephenate dehydratase [Methanobacterium sp.]BDZ66927.1 chorismate mutase [Methanobacterium ferruginis]
MRIGFFGPAGTFTEEAASSIGGELIPYDTIPEVFQAVHTGEVDRGVVPIENSIEGSVGVTLDLLAHQYLLKIRGEIVIPISHNLLINPDAELEDVEVVYSHYQPLSQCRMFLEKMGVKTQATQSTAAAAEMIIGHKNLAAIGTRRAALLYGLKIASEDIQDHASNMTRFVVIDHQDHIPTGKDKTSVVLCLSNDRPGGLYDILGEFASEDINLTKIESRPSKEKLGSYIFFVDLEGHHKDLKIRNVINRIRSKVGYIKILGSYPREGDD